VRDSVTEPTSSAHTRRRPKVSPWLALALGFMVLVGFAAIGDLSELTEHISRWSMETLLGVLGLSLVGYWIRAVRWALYLKRLRIDLPFLESSHIFFAGLVGSITPAKVGEVIKSVLLESRHDLPVTRTAPIVLAERVGDLLALVLLATAGVLSTGYGVEVVVAGGALSVLIVGAALWPPLGRFAIQCIARLPGLSRFAPGLEEARVTTQELFGTSTLVLGVSLSLLAWGCEALGTWWLIEALPGSEATLAQATFVFAFSTVAGALTFLPGGLLATEGSMVALLHNVLHMAPSLSSASAITLMVRAVTLWFGVALGGVALSTYAGRKSDAGEQGGPLP
jgi:uncharacterized membrane protein YbhN (UPF0104 family)